MKKDALISSLFLLIAMLIYIIWRSNDILLNHILGVLFSFQDLNEWKSIFSERLPLNDFLIYSLPGGLWVFASTVAFKNFYVVIKNQVLNLMFLPLIIALLIEILQLLPFGFGTFDFWDIVCLLIFWVGSLIVCPATEIKEEFLKSEDTTAKVWAIISIIILYLAHQI